MANFIYVANFTFLTLPKEKFIEETKYFAILHILGFFSEITLKFDPILYFHKCVGSFAIFFATVQTTFMTSSTKEEV